VGHVKVVYYLIEALKFFTCTMNCKSHMQNNIYTVKCNKLIILLTVDDFKLVAFDGAGLETEFSGGKFSFKMARVNFHRISI
jgi:hypothetical protein